MKNFQYGFLLCALCSCAWPSEFRPNDSGYHRFIPAFFKKVAWPMTLYVPEMRFKFDNLAAQPIELTTSAAQITLAPALWVPTRFTLACCCIAVVTWYMIKMHNAHRNKKKNE